MKNACVWLLACLLAALAGPACARPLIGAWYFTLWHHDAASGQLTAGQKLYGTTDPWAGVRQYAQGHGAVPITGPDGQPVDYSARVPKAGFYDLSDPHAIETQFAEAASTGLDFFAFYFYVDGSTGQPLPISSPVRAFYNASNRHGTALVVAPIVNPNGGARLSLANFRSNLLPVLVDLLASPAALRIQGRPAIVDWWLAPANPPTDYPAMYELLRQAVRARTHTDPYIIKLFAADVQPVNIAGAVQKLHPEAVTCFAFPMQTAEPYADYAASFLPGMQRQWQAVDGQAPYFPCSSIGQDPRPWFDVGWHGKTPQSRPYTTGLTPEAYRTALLATRRIVTGPLDPPQVAILYAWNEWGEAEADLEPSAKSGSPYADVVRQVFTLPMRR